MDKKAIFIALTVMAAVFGLFFGVPMLYGSFYVVDSGERAIVLRLGSIVDVTDAGFHIKTPFISSVVKVDMRTRKAHSPAAAASSDMQKVTTEVAVNYHLNPDKLAEIYTKHGLDLENKIIDPRIQEVVKAVTAKYQADKLLLQRETVKAEIEQEMKKALTSYYISVEAVQITNFSFSEQYEAAIEAKQTAEQNAQKAKNDLERIKIEAEQRVATARAEAEAIRIQSEAVRAQGGAEYVQLKAIEKWDGALPTYSGGQLPFIQIGK